jgi:hypothetical protein
MRFSISGTGTASLPDAWGASGTPPSFPALRRHAVAIFGRRGTARLRDLQMYLRGALRSADLKDLLKQFVEAGLIEWTGQGYRVSKPKEEEIET